MKKVLLLLGVFLLMASGQLVEADIIAVTIGGNVIDINSSKGVGTSVEIVRLANPAYQVEVEAIAVLP